MWPHWRHPEYFKLKTNMLGCTTIMVGILCKPFACSMSPLFTIIEDHIGRNIRTLVYASISSLLFFILYIADHTLHVLLLNGVNKLAPIFFCVIWRLFLYISHRMLYVRIWWKSFWIIVKVDANQIKMKQKKF